MTVGQHGPRKLRLDFDFTPPSAQASRNSTRYSVLDIASSIRTHTESLLTTQTPHRSTISGMFVAQRYVEPT